MKGVMRREGVRVRETEGREEGSREGRTERM